MAPSSIAQAAALRHAVRAFELARHTRNDGVSPSKADVIDLAAELPLTQLSRWERVMREGVDAAARSIAAGRPSGWRAWFSMRPDATTTRRPRTVPTWIDLVSWDGRERERALRAVDGAAPRPFFVALVARRLNDWVPEVRRAAREALPRIASASDPDHVVQALGALLPAWTSWKRIEADDRAVLGSLLCLDRVAPTLVRMVTRCAAGPMPALLGQALRRRELDTFLPGIAANAVQPAVRAAAYRALLAGKAVYVDGFEWRWMNAWNGRGVMVPVLGERPLPHGAALLDLLEAASADASPLVRRVAAQALVCEMDNLENAAERLARTLATDRSPSVRDRGVFVLKRLGIGD